MGDPKGILNPESTVTLALEGEDGTVHNFERDVPIPFPVAWSYRFGKRYNLPFISGPTSRADGVRAQARGHGREPRVIGGM